MCTLAQTWCVLHVAVHVHWNVCILVLLLWRVKERLVFVCVCSFLVKVEIYAYNSVRAPVYSHRSLATCLLLSTVQVHFTLYSLSPTHGVYCVMKSSIYIIYIPVPVLLHVYIYLFIYIVVVCVHYIRYVCTCV